MAPALTEPLSPTEKLSKTTATATPSTRANNRKVEGATTLTFTGTNNNINATNTVNNFNNNTNSNNNNIHTSSNCSGTLKRNRNSTHPTTSARITRSKDKEKDAEQRVEKSCVVAPSNTNVLTEVASSANQKSNNNNKSIHNNEQMGLSAALNNNNNNNKNNNTTNKCNNDSSAQIVANLKDTSTEQLLADLTDNFEEAITAEICLRKKLQDVDLHKAAEESNNVAGSILSTKDNAEDVLYEIEVESGGVLKAKLGSLHMDANIGVRSANIVQGKDVDNNDKIKSKTVASTPPPPSPSPHTRPAHVVDAMDVDSTANSTTAKVAAEKHIMPPSCALVELPLINTDSTITASEIEDNLEERLSQLDGTAVSSCAQDLHDMSSAESAMCSMVPATPPRTPTQQQMHQQQLQQLQAQLQHTPPQQQHSLTPQSTTSSSSYLKDATAAGGNNCGGGGSNSGTGTGGTGGEIEDQELEEVLKVLKGFDGSGGPDALCDLNVFFNEVYTTLNEEMTSNNQITATAAPKCSPFKDLHADIEKKHLSLQRKIDFMLRRLRKLQARYMCKHASEEISGLFELSARLTINKSGTGVTDTAPTTSYNSNINDEASSKSPPIISGRPPAITWQELRKTPVSSAQVSSMLRKLESAANTQQLHTGPPHSSAIGNNLYLHLKKSKKAAAQEALAAAAAAASAAKDTSTVVVPYFDSNISEELTYVAGLLQTEMREVQTAMDSDATESSSGAESADEIVTYNNPIQQSLSIAKRAAWRYSRDRAAIASRWSWLLSQIADLEIKIRQHSELMQEIVRSKGPLLCATDAATGIAKKHPSSADTLELAPSSVSSYMGVCGNTAGADISSNEGEDANASAGCCRTRGYMAAQFRKRKLLQTTNIHTISKKAARPSTIKCGCQWPLHPCALCTGRVDPTAPRDLPDTMMMPDRIALLDPGYHPVLSFPEDVSNAIHFEAIARLPDWQQRVMRCQVKSIAKGVWKAEREAAAAAGHGTTTKRRYIKKKDRLAEEKNATTASASVATTTATTNSGSSTSAYTTAIGHTAGSSSSGGGVIDTNMIGGAGNGGLGGSGGSGGNGIGTLSTSTTPLVANRLTKNAKKSLHCVQMGDAMQEPKSPGEMHYGHSQNSYSYVHQTGDYPPPPPAPQNYDPYNPSQAHSSLISSGKNNKHRKYGYYNHHYHQQQHNNHNNNNIIHYNNYNNNSSYYNNSNGGDMSFVCTADNWDNSTRSRTSSPTHMSNNSNYKYERSLDRKNRTSYDIDNIVIPYSVAAATRVEILPYKEIPTPKWRIIADVTGTVDSGMQLNEITSEMDTKIKPETYQTNITVSSNKVPINGIKEADEKCSAIVEIKTDVEMTDASLENKDSNAEKLRDKSQPLKAVNVEVVSSQKMLEKNVIAIEKPIKDSKMIKLENENAAEPVAKKMKTEKTETIPKSPVKAEHTENVKSIKAELSTAIEQMYSDEEEEDGVEDISDDAMTLRHERALTEERRKFQTFLKFPWSTRSRANRRIDSRAESSGANTPDPTSPAPQTPSVGGGDQESIPSPLAPSTPLNPLDTSEIGEPTTATTATFNAAKLNNSSKRYERRRTTSAKKERELERRSSTPDPREFIAPYESLKFPLSDELYESLLHTMPTEFQEYSKIENYANTSSVRLSRMRNNTRGSDHSSARRSSKSTVINLLSGSARKPHRRSSGKGVRLKNSGNTYENGKIQMLEELERTSLTTGDDDDDDANMPEFIADDDDDDDYPKHHLAPNDDDDELLRGANTSCHGSTVHSTFGPQLDEYEAYVGGGRNILGDSDADSSATEPFQDDDPNDPEWKGESEDRSERLRKKL